MNKEDKLQALKEIKAKKESILIKKGQKVECPSVKEW